MRDTITATSVRTIDGQNKALSKLCRKTVMRVLSTIASLALGLCLGGCGEIWGSVQWDASQPPLQEFDQSWTPEWSSIQIVWHLNGTLGSISSGATISDSSGNGNDGSMSGAGASFVAGKLNQAVNTSGTQFISIPGGTAPNPCSLLTVAFWFNSTSPVAFQGLTTKTGFGVGSPGYTVEQQGANNSLQLRMDTSAGANQSHGWFATDDFFDGNWHHIAFTLNNGNIALYKDGSLDRSWTYLVGGGFCNNTVPFELSSNVAGTFDEFALWSTMLTAAEIQTIYTVQSPTYAKNFRLPLFDLNEFQFAKIAGTFKRP